MKKVSSAAVLVGGIPGALPCLIGWAAGQDELSIGGWVLFAIQFFWQFPHFWAIAWIAHKDYTRAGFKLMPSVEGPTKYSAMQALIYSLVLIAGWISSLPGWNEWHNKFVDCFCCNLFMIFQCYRLYREMEKKAARRVMFSSYIYLPVVLLALLADKVN